MSFDTIRIGDKVELKSIYNPNVVYSSKAVDILDVKERMISIYTPVLAGTNMPMRSDETYIATIFTNHNLIRFKCTFEGYLKEELNFFVVLRLLDNGDKIQRREFFRFTCMLAMKFSIMDFGDNEAARVMHNQGVTEKYDAVVRDIGGGGIRFITHQDLELEHPIQCTIMLGVSTMMLNGRLLEKQYMPRSGMKFQYRALFLDISTTAQEEIVNYIFTEQRRQRKMSFAAK